MNYTKIDMSKESEIKINDIIVKKLAAEQIYSNLASLCTLEKVNLINFCEYFRLCSIRSRLLAEKLINQQTLLGGEFVFERIENFVQIPHGEEMNKQCTVKTLMLVAVETEKVIEKEIEALLRIAEEKREHGMKESVRGLLLPGQQNLVSEHIKQLQVLDTMKQEIEMNENTRNADTRLMAEWKFDRIVMPELIEKMKYLIYTISKPSENQMPTMLNTNKNLKYHHHY